MFMKNTFKTLTLFTFVLCTFISMSINSYAFDGKVLGGPEEGWNRYRFPSSELIKYSGDWEVDKYVLKRAYMYSNESEYENGQVNYKYFDENSKIEFKFKGTSLRLLGINKKNQNVKFKVMIDDKVDEEFFMKYEDYPGGVPVLFEKTDMENKEHSVTIMPLKYPERGNDRYLISLSGIDVDGQLVNDDGVAEETIEDIDLEPRYTNGDHVGLDSEPGWSRFYFYDNIKSIQLNEHMSFVNMIGNWKWGYIYGSGHGALSEGKIIKDENGNEIYDKFDPDSNLEFTFKGTGFRILSTRAMRASDYRIIINDEIVEEFRAENTVDFKDYDWVGNQIIYEKLYMDKDIYNVKIQPLKNINGEGKLYERYNFQIAGIETTDHNWVKNEYDTVLNIDAEESISLDKEIEADVIIDNIKKITAEDIRIKYDSSKLEFLGYKEVEGIKIVKSIKNGNEIRVVLSSKGKDNIINDREVLLKLRFKATDMGDALIKITKGRVTDGIELEKELEQGECGKLRIAITKKEEKKIDIDGNNRFNLVDLGIEGRIFNKDPNSQELSDYYNVDIVEDGVIDELDLLEIGRKVLESQN